MAKSTPSFEFTNGGIQEFVIIYLKNIHGHLPMSSICRFGKLLTTGFKMKLFLRVWGELIREK